MLKLKLQYFGHLIQRADPFEKTPKLGKIEYFPIIKLPKDFFLFMSTSKAAHTGQRLMLGTVGSSRQPSTRPPSQ